jgi:hypothetical protein
MVPTSRKGIWSVESYLFRGSASKRIIEEKYLLGNNYNPR